MRYRDSINRLRGNTFGLPCLKPSAKGFTLAELLIALAILGVIATFTIPKVLNSQQNSQSNSIAKEVAGSISEALAAYKLENTITASTGPADLTPYLNYVALDTTTIIDDIPTAGSPSVGCNSSHCLLLHNGARIRYVQAFQFGGTDDTNAIWFMVDPDGKYDGGTTADGPSKSIMFWLYANGRLRTNGSTEPNTCNSSYCDGSPTPASDPSWFSWD